MSAWMLPAAVGASSLFSGLMGSFGSKATPTFQQLSRGAPIQDHLRDTLIRSLMGQNLPTDPASFAGTFSLANLTKSPYERFQSIFAPDVNLQGREQLFKTFGLPLPAEFPQFRSMLAAEPRFNQAFTELEGFKNVTGGLLKRTQDVADRLTKVVTEQIFNRPFTPETTDFFPVYETFRSAIFPELEDVYNKQARPGFEADVLRFGSTQGPAFQNAITNLFRETVGTPASRALTAAVAEAIDRTKTRNLQGFLGGQQNLLGGVQAITGAEGLPIQAGGLELNRIRSIGDIAAELSAAMTRAQGLIGSQAAGVVGAGTPESPAALLPILLGLLNPAGENVGFPGTPSLTSQIGSAGSAAGQAGLLFSLLNPSNKKDDLLSQLLAALTKKPGETTPDLSGFFSG